MVAFVTADMGLPSTAPLIGTRWTLLPDISGRIPVGPYGNEHTVGRVSQEN